MYSKLANVIIPADKSNYTQGRPNSKGISTITIHHAAGIGTSEDIGTNFRTANRGGSSHYGIGFQGDIAAYVDENDTAWSDSNWESNLRTISIELSNNHIGDPYSSNGWSCSEETFDSLILLLVDIRYRNGLSTLVKGENLVWHSMFAPTICPSDYVINRLDDICDRANNLYTQLHAWSSEAVLNFIHNGYLKGDGNGNFRLPDHITREEVVTLMYRMRGDN